MDYESVTFGYTFKAEWFLQDNVTINNHFLQDPLNPVTRPITNRRRRHALLVASNENKQTHDPIEMETNKLENTSTSNDHYEKYDVEAIEIDSGLTGVDTDEDDDFYVNDENNAVHDKGNDDQDEEHDDDEDQDEKDYLPSKNQNAYPKDLSTARWTLFKGIEMLAQKFV